jgi:enediyne biosynthesis protein E4
MMRLVYGSLVCVVLALAGSASSVHFTDVTTGAGIHFTHNNGAFGKKYLPETMGSGCAFIDTDGSGWPDVLLLNGKGMSAFYRNTHNGTFRDSTAGSGLDVPMQAMGVAVADYDNDGRPDVYITAMDGDRLFHNDGGGKFRDVTVSSGIKNANFGVSAAWVDYDRDGRADLFVANYIRWTPATDVWCSLDGKNKSYCTPENSKGAPSKLYRNLGNGKFEDVSVKAGVADPKSKSMSVVVLDFDNDGWPDLFVPNDTQPNKLYRNNRNGTFTEVGVTAGIAFGQDGAARGAMGADAIDYDRTGRQHLIVGNFSNQMLGLYHNEGNGVFIDRAPSSVVGPASLFSLTFGAFFFDYDLDGHPDIFAANGHTEESIERIDPRVKFREPPLMFRNLCGGRFENISDQLGKDFSNPLVARGAAYGDFDHDGDLDILLTTNNGPAVLYRNDGGNQNHWLRIRLNGTKSNRSGLGAVVRIESASGKQWSMMRSGGSYASQSDLALTFGLGNDSKVTRLSVEWPSGTRQNFTDLAPNQFLLVDETKGVLGAQ